MLPALLLAAVVVTHPAPAGDVVDFANLMVMDVSLRGTHHKMPGWAGDVTFGDKIVNTKFGPEGDTWDAWSFDNDFVYFFATGSSLDYTGVPTVASSPYVPRYAQLGSPGTKLVNRANYVQRVVECERQPIEGPMNLYLTEVWGPFAHDFAGGIGHQDNVISVRYYWDCLTDDPMSCGHLEENWYVAPYGWVQWAHSVNPTHTGTFSSPPHTETFDTLVEGGPGFTMWCDRGESSDRPAKPVAGGVANLHPRRMPKRHEVTFSGACTPGGPVITAVNGAVRVTLDWTLVVPPYPGTPGDTWSQIDVLAPGEGEQWASPAPSLYLIASSRDDAGRVDLQTWSQSCP